MNDEDDTNIQCGHWGLEMKTRTAHSANIDEIIAAIKNGSLSFPDSRSAVRPRPEVPSHQRAIDDVLAPHLDPDGKSVRQFEAILRKEAADTAALRDRLNAEAMAGSKERGAQLGAEIGRRVGAQCFALETHGPGSTPAPSWPQPPARGELAGLAPAVKPLSWNSASTVDASATKDVGVLPVCSTTLIAWKRVRSSGLGIGVPAKAPRVAPGQPVAQPTERPRQ
jgi:hypothetical protein